MLGADKARLRELYLNYVKLGAQSPHTMIGFERYVVSRTPKSTTLGGELRSLRAAMLTEKAGLGGRLLRTMRQGATYRAPAADPQLGPLAPPRVVLLGADLQPGMRIDHPQQGRGTVAAIAGDVAQVVFDAKPNQPPEPVPVAGAGMIHAADPDSRFGDPPPFRTTSEVNARLDEIAQFRKDARLPEFSQDATTGTAAAVLLGGEVFHGTNSGLDAPNYSLSIEARRIMFDQLVKQFGLQVPDGAFQNAQFLGHAEAEAMLLAYQHFGRLPEVVEIYADRTTCNDCSTNLILLARMLGVRELRVYYRNQSDPPLIRR
jgi:hypothetical protein